MKNIGQDQEYNRNQETYQRFIKKIGQITKSNIQSINQQNHSTIGSNAIEIKSEIYANKVNPSKFEANDEKEQQRQIFEKMNQHLLNRRRNAEWSQNQNNITNFNNNEKKFSRSNETNQNKIFHDMKNTGKFNEGGKNPIVQYQYQFEDVKMKIDNNAPQTHQHHILNINKNNDYNPFKTNYENKDNFKNNQSINSQNKNINNQQNSYQSNEFSNDNQFNNINNILENSNTNSINNQRENILSFDEKENSSEPKKSSICSSLIYGLIFGSFGTLLLWCKNPRVREHLKSCYQNINSESILNFFKMFLHPIDLIQKIGNNMGNLGEILKQSLKYLYEFIEEYSDLWRLLGIIVMVYALWLIIKKIFRMFNKKKKKMKVIKNEYKFQIFQ